MVIVQGDIFWLDMATPRGSEPGYRHPVVVVQNDAFNQSSIRTAVVAVITSNLARASSPGNVLLSKGEGNLSRRSTVNITQLLTVDRQRLQARIGTLSKQTLRRIIAGIILLVDPG